MGLYTFRLFPDHGLHGRQGLYLAMIIVKYSSCFFAQSYLTADSLRY